MAKQLVTFTVEPYGEFTAAVRDFETHLQISYKADEYMIQRNMDPNKAGPSTRNLFFYLAVFTSTCETSPDGFDIGEFLRSDPGQAQAFLLNYVEGLVEKENSFREGGKEVPAEQPVPNASEESV